MSSNLLWEPIKPIPASRTLGTELKFALRKMYGDPVRVELNQGDIKYLRGLKHGGIKEAQKLIEAVDKYGSVKVWEEH